MSVSVLKHVCLCSIWSSSPPETWFWEAHHRNHFAGPRLICYHGRKGTSSWWPFYQYFSQIRAFWQNESCAQSDARQVEETITKCAFCWVLSTGVLLWEGRRDLNWVFPLQKTPPEKYMSPMRPMGKSANFGQENDHKLHGFVPELHILVGPSPKWAFFNSIALYQNCTFWSG